MNKKVYKVDLSKKVTPKIARNAVISCFVEAHKEELAHMKEFQDFESNGEFEKLKKLNVEILVQSMFDKIGGDFNNPTKKDLGLVCEKLAEFAKNFRNPEIIKKHKDLIMKILDELE